MKSSKNKDLKSVYDRSCKRTTYTAKSTSPPTFKPSILGSPCLRKVYYSYNKVPEDQAFPLANARTTNLGTAIGKMLFDAFDKEGIAIKYKNPDGSFNKDFDGNVDYEFPVVAPDLGIKKGKIDLVAVLDDGLWLGEIKSIKSFYSEYTEPSQLVAPKPDHLIQGVLYLYLFNQQMREGKYAHIPELAGFSKANGIRFVYYSKEKSEIREFVVTEADDIFRNIVLKIEHIKFVSQTRQLPPKTPDFCKSCAWKNRCDKNLNVGE